MEDMALVWGTAHQSPTPPPKWAVGSLPRALPGDRLALQWEEVDAREELALPEVCRPFGLAMVTSSRALGP